MKITTRMTQAHSRATALIGGVAIAGVVLMLGCTSKNAAVNLGDASSERSSEGGGANGKGGSAAGGGSGGVTGTGGVTVAQGLGGRTGTGGAGGVAGAGGGAAGAGFDSGVRDGAYDQESDVRRLDGAIDAPYFCEPGYPVGSQKPWSDCNTCFCQGTGTWMCTTHVCAPALDAALDAATDSAIAGKDSGIDASPACTQLTVQSDCQARSDCHAVFTDPGTCGCSAAGCCARFSRCADGKATCSGNPMCETSTPHCEGPYVVSYTANCYEGTGPAPVIKTTFP